MTSGATHIAAHPGPLCYPRWHSGRHRCGTGFGRPRWKDRATRAPEFPDEQHDRERSQESRFTRSLLGGNTPGRRERLRQHTAAWRIAARSCARQQRSQGL